VLIEFLCTADKVSQQGEEGSEEEQERVLGPQKDERKRDSVVAGKQGNGESESEEASKACGPRKEKKRKKNLCTHPTHLIALAAAACKFHVKQAIRRQYKAKIKATSDVAERFLHETWEALRRLSEAKVGEVWSLWENSIKKSLLESDKCTNEQAKRTVCPLARSLVHAPIFVSHCFQCT
jgi:organic hydroperoxide reductase OsmC/OhrA